MVSVRNWFVINNQKFGLPQVSPAHIPYHDLYFPIIINSNVSRVQQKSGRSTSVVGAWRLFLPAFRIGQVHPGAVYRKVSSETSRQVKKFCIRLFTQSNCSGLLFHSHFVSARLWNRNGYFCGDFYNAFYSRAQKKISGSFYSCNNSFYSISNFKRRISNPKNHCLFKPVARSFGNRVSSHTIFLRIWKRWFLGGRFRRKLTKTFSPSRSSHRFYLFSHRRRVGLCRNYGNCSLILNFYLERSFDSLPSKGSLWNTFGNRANSANRITGFYQSWSSFGSPPYKGVDVAFYKHGRIVDAGDDAFCGHNT